MKKATLIKKVGSMDNGDSFSVEFTDLHGCELGTYISRTRWFDSFMYVIGGADDEIITTTIREDEDAAEEIVNGFMKFYELADDTNFKVGNKSEITIVIKSKDWINTEDADNMICESM